MKHYYLINGTVKVSDSKMPEKHNYNEPYIMYNEDFNYWYASLQPCEIDESELIKIKHHLMMNGGDLPIDITDIIFEKDGKIYFKQPVEQKIELGDTIEYTIDNKNTPHLHGKTFRVEVASIDENNCYVYAPYGQDIVPIKQAKLIKKQPTEKQVESDLWQEFLEWKRKQNNK